MPPSWSTSPGAQEVYDPDGTSWFLHYFAIIFTAGTLVVGALAYLRVLSPGPATATPATAVTR